jgi:hypothetical protein
MSPLPATAKSLSVIWKAKATRGQRTAGVRPARKLLILMNRHFWKGQDLCRFTRGGGSNTPRMEQLLTRGTDAAAARSGHTCEIGRGRDASRWITFADSNVELLTRSCVRGPEQQGLRGHEKSHVLKRKAPPRLCRGRAESVSTKRGGRMRPDLTIPAKGAVAMG